VLTADVLQSYDSLDMIVNAAGGGYERTLGMYRVSRALIPVLRRGTAGNVLLNIPPSSAEAGLAIFPYASSLQAFQRLSAALAAETRGSAIRVLIGCPRDGHVTEVLPDRNARTWERGWEYDHGGMDDWKKLTRQVACLVGLSGDADETRRAG
jgi:NAD(P)-dependent dehydrogenase (short-subunit alcohol dehydrogenase family)